MRLEHHLVGGYVRYISPHIIIIIIIIRCLHGYSRKYLLERHIPECRGIPVQGNPCAGESLCRGTPVQGNPCAGEPLCRGTPVQGNPCAGEPLCRGTPVQGNPLRVKLIGHSFDNISRFYRSLDYKI